MTEPTAVAVVLAVLVGGYLLMWRGWRRRSRAQSDLPPLPPELPEADVLAGPVAGVYVGTTTSGDWTDRVVAHTLGRRSHASVTITAAGVTVDRSPEPALYVPAATLRAVRIDRAGGGRAVRHPEYLILSWSHGDAVLDTAVRPDHPHDLERLRAAGASLLPQGATP